MTPKFYVKLIEFLRREDTERLSLSVVEPLVDTNDVANHVRWEETSSMHAS